MDAEDNREYSCVQCEYPSESLSADSSMTKEYRQTLLRLMANQAYGELHASNLYKPWIKRAPGAEERTIISKIVDEELAHWRSVVDLMGDLGIPPEKVHSHQSFHHFYPLARLFVPVVRWTDILMSTFLIDRAAYFMLEDYSQSSYTPWAKAVQVSLEEEVEHGQFGMGFLSNQIEKLGTPAAQKALNKWWCIALNMYGPPKSRHHDTYLRLGLKYRSNEDRRQIFIADSLVRIDKIGLTMPKLLRNRYPYF